MDDDVEWHDRELHCLNEIELLPRPLAHRLSAPGRQWLKEVERLHLAPCDEETGQPLGEWRRGATIGHGHSILPVEWERFRGGVDQAWAEAMLRYDLRDVEHAVVRRFRDCNGPQGAGLQGRSEREVMQHEFDALVILAFSIGAGAFNLSSVAAMICELGSDTTGDSLEAAWKAWCWSDGRRRDDLIRRRAGEWRIFHDADYVLPR